MGKRRDAVSSYSLTSTGWTSSSASESSWTTKEYWPQSPHMLENDLTLKKGLQILRRPVSFLSNCYRMNVACRSPNKLLAQNNDWYRGPTELFQQSAYRGSSHRRKGADRHILDMVWLYRSSFPVGRRGIFTGSNNFYMPSRRLEKGERRVSIPWPLATYSCLVYW
jgi:hypothetical protein